MTHERYAEDLERLRTSRHEAAHVAMAFMLGEPVDGVFRLKDHSGGTLVPKRTGDTAEENYRILFRRLAIMRAPLAVGDLEAEKQDGPGTDRAESERLARPLAVHRGTTTTDILRRVDLAADAIVTKREFKDVQNAVAKALVQKHELSDVEVYTIAASASVATGVRKAAVAQPFTVTIDRSKRPKLVVKKRLGPNPWRGTFTHKIDRKARAARKAAAVQAAETCKYGRVLSKANEDTLRAALESVTTAVNAITDVLGTVTAVPAKARKIITPRHVRDQREAEVREMERMAKEFAFNAAAARMLAAADTTDDAVAEFIRETKAHDAREAAEAEELKKRVRGMDLA